MTKKCVIILFAFIMILSNYAFADEIPSLGSKAIYLVEPTTGKVIYEKNAHEKMYPASTTKILTALVVIENCKLDEKAIVSERAISMVPEGYSNAGLKVGEELDIKTLLYALLVPSANEAANVLAEHVSGSIEEFAELCNKRAKELGCENLHFVNANGIHDENHYCSAYDLYLIAKECQKHDIFNEIVKTKSFTLPATNIYKKEDRTYKNTNELLLSGKYFYDYCTGIKTGFTTPAGECLVGSAFNNDIELISVVLGGKAKNSKGLNERFADTKELYEYTYSNYSIKEIANSGDIIATLKVGKGTKETTQLDAIVDDTIKTIVPNELDKDNVLKTVIINKEIVAPVTRGQVLGTITYDADGLVYTANLVASHDVEKNPYVLYNIIVVLIYVLTIVLFLKMIKKSKKKNRVRLLMVAILIFETTCGIFICKAEEKNHISTVNILVDHQISEDLNM